MLIIIFIIASSLLFLIYASAYIGSNVYIKTLCKKKTKNKEIVITFDDGVDPINTPKILDILQKNNIIAYFFIIGNKAAKYPEIVKRIIQEGHYIGIHSYNHQYYFPLKSARAIENELYETKKILENITKKQINLFRPPFGVTNPHIAKAVKKLDLSTIGWSIRSYDTTNQDIDKIIYRVKKKLRPGSILLLHDRLNESDKLLIEIIDLLKYEDYCTTTL